MKKKVILMILDGWGITQNPEVSAIAKAHTPCMDELLKKYPHDQLLTHGMHVGLPEGQMGNSEVGHMNLGAGRIVYQDLAKINKAVREERLLEEPILKAAFQKAKKEQQKVHFIGLVSNGGVHSHIDHLKGLLTAASKMDLEQVYVHAFTDGRDVDPRSGVGFLKELSLHMKQSTGQIASVIGRYYAMDRDKRWERIKKAYDLLVFGKGKAASDVIEAVAESYKHDVTDEFIEPIVCTRNGQPLAAIEPGDLVIFFNFRTDRGRQLTEVLTQKDMPEQGMSILPLDFITLTNYDDTFNGIQIVFNKEHITKPLGEILEQHNIKQIRIAETEKYPHVTFFFNGGREHPFKGEKRILCPSPKVATYDLQPEMSAYDVRDRILPEIEDETADFICLNFANPDMVGHTGVFEAAVKACETVDKCMKEIIAMANSHGYTTIVLADHGNSEKMRNEDGSPNTSHTTNPVPIIVVDPDISHIKGGILGDIAPTILKLMEIEKPKEMTGSALV